MKLNEVYKAAFRMGTSFPKCVFLLSVVVWWILTASH